MASFEGNLRVSFAWVGEEVSGMGKSKKKRPLGGGRFCRSNVRKLLWHLANIVQQTQREARCSIPRSAQKQWILGAIRFCSPDPPALHVSIPAVRHFRHDEIGFEAVASQPAGVATTFRRVRIALIVRRNPSKKDTGAVRCVAHEHHAGSQDVTPHRLVRKRLPPTKD